MAKPKENVLVKIAHPDSIQYQLHVWADNATDHIEDIMTIEGTTDVIAGYKEPTFLFISVDPRYDFQEVADEIEALLLSFNEVPDIFKQ